MALSEQHRSTARVLDILELLADAPEGRTLTELSAALNAPKSSLFPIIHTLADRKYIKAVGDSGRYSLGVSTYALGVGFTQHQDLLATALEIMKDLTDRCQETCQLAVLEQSNVLYIGKVDSPQAVRLISHVGTRLPANCTSLGKALLSGRTDDQVRALFPDGLPHLTSHSITDMDQLLIQLSEIRARGYASEREEANEHVSCLAVPLRYRGSVFAAVSVSIPLFRYSQAQHDLILDGLREIQARMEQMVVDLNLPSDDIF